MNKVSAVNCERLSKTYVEGKIRVPVLKDIAFSVQPGELVAIVGASGAGKSTFLQLLGGLDKPTDGRVFVAGHDINQLSETEKGKIRNRYLGFIYQFHHLLPEFNALENVCLPLLMRGVKPKLAKARALEYIERVGLTNRQTHRIGELSGGERQRIAIARALVTEPHCVLADEPTGNLDQGTAAQVGELILELNRVLKTSFVIVTHNLDLAKKMNRLLVLEQGNLNARENR